MTSRKCFMCLGEKEVSVPFLFFFRKKKTCPACQGAGVRQLSAPPRVQSIKGSRRFPETRRVTALSTKEDHDSGLITAVAGGAMVSLSHGGNSEPEEKAAEFKGEGGQSGGAGASGSFELEPASDNVSESSTTESSGGMGE